MEKIYKTTYSSPAGKLHIVASEQGLVGCYFGEQGAKKSIEAQQIVDAKNNKFLLEAINWLDLYFAGEQPSIESLQLAPRGTQFQCDVWECLKEIPYGKTTTYGSIARTIAQKYGKQKMSAQAVGRAVGSNPLGIIVPCHRVVGAGGRLVGYAGGIDKKIALLTHEGLKIDNGKNRLIVSK